VAKTYWVVIPFRQAEAGDFAPQEVRVKTWVQTVPTKIDKGDADGGKKKIEVIYADTLGQPLLGAQPGDSIYIFGHGDKGRGNVRPTSSNTGIQANATAVAELLVAKGLKEGFTGKVKFYNCNSAVPPDNDTDKSHCFAGACVKQLRETHKITSPTYIGYAGSIDGYYTSFSERKGQVLMESLAKINESVSKGTGVPKIGNNFNQLTFADEEIHRWLETVEQLEDGTEMHKLTRAKEVQMIL
jgi:hypothetical protein